MDHHTSLAHSRVPGILVDHVLLCHDAELHRMTFGEQHNPAYLQPWHGAEPAPPAEAVLDARTLVQRRAALELVLRRPRVVNLGVGMPAAVGALAHAAGLGGYTLTVEARR